MSFKVCKYAGVIKKRMLKIITKETRYQQLERLVCYFSDEHISTFNSSTESRRTTFFEKRPNASFSFLGFNIF